MTRYADPGILPRVQVHAERRMLEAAEPIAVLRIGADEYNIPQNNSDTIVLRRPVPFEPVTTPLLEGVTPDVSPFRYEDVRKRVEQYGQVTQISDKVQIVHQDPVLMSMMEQLGENVTRTNEQLMWGELRSGTNVFYANGSSRAAVNLKVSREMVNNITQELETQHSKRFTKIVKGSVLIGTQPIQASYLAYTHTHMMHDIENIEGFVPTSEYGTMKAVHEQEFGATGRLRWITSPDLQPFYAAGGTPGTTVRGSSTAADVYPIFITGKNAYACVKIRGWGSMTPYIVPVDQPSKTDVLNQRGYAGVKWPFACVITNELWCGRLETAVSKLAGSA